MNLPLAALDKLATENQPNANEIHCSLWKSVKKDKRWARGGVGAAIQVYNERVAGYNSSPPHKYFLRGELLANFIPRINSSCFCSQCFNVHNVNVYNVSV